MNSKTKRKTKKFRYSKGTFSVAKFLEELEKLFECIPDLWFYNEEKTLCYWPPKSKKSVTLRAMNQDEPEEDWIVYDCELVSEGHGKITNYLVLVLGPVSVNFHFITATYSIGCNIAKEKAAQKYNTSSADEYMQAARFRREHPGLIHNGEQSFENIFANAKVAQETVQKSSVVSNVADSEEIENGAEVDNTCCPGNVTSRSTPRQCQLGTSSSIDQNIVLRSVQPSSVPIENGLKSNTKSCLNSRSGTGTNGMFKPSEDLLRNSKSSKRSQSNTKSSRPKPRNRSRSKKRSTSNHRSMFNSHLKSYSRSQSSKRSISNRRSRSSVRSQSMNSSKCSSRF